MTNTSPVRRPTFVSPFLLPYLQADREDTDKRVRAPAHDVSPNGTIMLSPMEDRHGRESVQSTQAALYRTAVTSPQRKPESPFSPKSKLSADSPGATRRSMIERSISELTFDPDLTFMDSPGRSSTLTDQSPDRNRELVNSLDTSLPVFSSPMRTVSPDTSLVPLDDSEIGFSNDLRASLNHAPAATLITDNQPSMPLVKRRKVTAYTYGTVTHHRIPESDQFEDSNVEAQVTGSDTKILTEASAPVDESRKRGPSKRGKLKEFVPVVTRPEPAKSSSSKETAEVDIASETPRTKRGSAKEHGAHPPKPTVGDKSSSTSKKRKVNDDVPVHMPVQSKAQPEAIRVTERTSRNASASSLRQSPRFSSKVITARTQVPPLMICPHCKKAYKRARDFEKHVGSCK